MGNNCVKYTRHNGKVYRQPINWWRHDGINRGFNACDIPADGSIKCLACGANDWTENGESINQYECACCGASLTVEPRND